MKNVFIVTYGRSGSTLLMRVLNSIEGADIKGENNNLLYYIFKSYQKSKEAKKFGGDDNSNISPWYGNKDINPEKYTKSLINSFVSEILQPKPVTKITGFKEIRYLTLVKNREFATFLDFMHQFFDNSYIIFNTRNVENTAKSGWWKKQPRNKVIGELNLLKERMEAYHKKHPEYTYMVHYDNYKDNPEYFRGMFDFIDEDFDLDKISAIMGQQLNHCKK